MLGFKISLESRDIPKPLNVSLNYILSIFYFNIRLARSNGKICRFAKQVKAYLSQDVEEFLLELLNQPL